MEAIMEEGYPLIVNSQTDKGLVGRAKADETGVTFYGFQGVEENALCELYSSSYGSCVGISIHREGTQKGLLAHFWNYKIDPDVNFLKALEFLIKNVWVDVMPNIDNLMIWIGVRPNQITYNRLDAFCKIWEGQNLNFAKSLKGSTLDCNFKSISMKSAAFSGEVHLVLDGGYTNLYQGSVKSGLAEPELHLPQFLYYNRECSSPKIVKIPLSGEGYIQMENLPKILK